MGPLLYLAIITGALLVYVTLWYIYGLRLNRLDVADEAWGLAQPFIVLVALLVTGNYSPSTTILFAITLFWGYRLFSHLHKRHAASKTEDLRYAEMRANWKRFPKLQAYVYVFVLQGGLMFLLGAASMLLVYTPTTWNYLSLIGIGIWAFGYIFEAVADKQLRLFVSNPDNKGKIMNQGLWKYSRHPNYFGEVTMWWGIFLYTLLLTGLTWSIITPITITLLIVFVSGIPLTEKHFAGAPLWDEYKRRTSPLIPWFPKG